MVILVSFLGLVLIFVLMLVFALVYFFVMGLVRSSSWCVLCPNGDPDLFPRSGVDHRPDAGLRPLFFLCPVAVLFLVLV